MVGQIIGVVNSIREEYSCRKKRYRQAHTKSYKSKWIGEFCWDDKRVQL